MPELEETYCLAALAHSLGRADARREIACHGSARAALAGLPGSRGHAARLRDDCERNAIDLLTEADPNYPALLRAIPDAPLVLYGRGDPAAVLRPTVAVVGARRCTRTGAEVAVSLGAELARSGACVVSGLALGIDTAAHRGAVSAGTTVAVVGSGIARPYPAANGTLADAIVESGGWLLSEYPPWHGARRYHFPERNRLISGLAMGVVVVEAGEHSGSLITARMAAEQGREVCAVPGAVTSPMSRGCHRLIREGAALVENAEQVLDALGLERGTAKRGDGMAPRPGDDLLAGILAVVEGTVTTLDDVLAATGVTGEAASAALVELELAGFVRQVPGGYIRRPLR